MHTAGFSNILLNHLRMIILILLATAISTPIFAQEEDEIEHSEENELHGRHRLTIGMGHAHIPAGISEGEKNRLNLGAFTVDYDFAITPKWSVGLHTDVIPTNYEVESEKSDEAALNRTSPVSVVLAGTYRFTEHISVHAGYGQEITKEESLSVLRLGAEYAVEIRNGWEAAISLTYDRKVETYNTWFLGVGFGKWLGKPFKE